MPSLFGYISTTFTMAIQVDKTPNINHVVQFSKTHPRIQPSTEFGILHTRIPVTGPLSRAQVWSDHGSPMVALSPYWTPLQSFPANIWCWCHSKVFTSLSYPWFHDVQHIWFIMNGLLQYCNIKISLSWYLVKKIMSMLLMSMLAFLNIKSRPNDAKRLIFADENGTDKIIVRSQVFGNIISVYDIMLITTWYAFLMDIVGNGEWFPVVWMCWNFKHV